MHLAFVLNFRHTILYPDGDTGRQHAKNMLPVTLMVEESAQLYADEKAAPERTDEGRAATDEDTQDLAVAGARADFIAIDKATRERDVVELAVIVKAILEEAADERLAAKLAYHMERTRQ
ncbi:hypothetical protein BTUL_0010g01180 [Botrytis tulipae]|uniref:Uncharacterized protein n=1 Tax=Botrytis tulipae TaxID=87230 RepID=A0A4Z1FAL4_9HELO|nr:hypothetical protein BTUL_0010g01180 [Botrytis tulipae]